MIQSSFIEVLFVDVYVILYRHDTTLDLQYYISFVSAFLPMLNATFRLSSQILSGLFCNRSHVEFKLTFFIKLLLISLQMCTLNTQNADVKLDEAFTFQLIRSSANSF